MGRKKKMIATTLTHETYQEARKLGLNFSEILEQALKAEISGRKGENVEKTQANGGIPVRNQCGGRDSDPRCRRGRAMS